MSSIGNLWCVQAALLFRPIIETARRGKGKSSSRFLFWPAKAHATALNAAARGVAAAQGNN